jgi:hypothetical protein
MKRQKSCGPRLGKLVHQLPGVVTFAYDLRFRRVIARWKGIVEEIHFGGSIMPSAIIEHLDLKKPSFRPSKWPRKLNLLKIVNCQNCQKTILSQSEKVGGHQYPPGSAILIIQPDWIIEARDEWKNDEKVWTLIKRLQPDSSASDTFTWKNDSLWYKDRLYLCKNSQLKQNVLLELHTSPVGGHSGFLKTYHRVKKDFFWDGLKTDVQRFVAECLVFQQNKVETIKTPGLLQPLSIPS